MELLLPRTDAGVALQGALAAVAFAGALLAVRRSPELRRFVVGLATMAAASSAYGPCTDGAGVQAHPAPHVLRLKARNRYAPGPARWDPGRSSASPRQKTQQVVDIAATGGVGPLAPTPPCGRGRRLEGSAAAPSSTNTQGIKDSKDRRTVPPGKPRSQPTSTTMPAAATYIRILEEVVDSLRSSETCASDNTFPLVANPTFAWAGAGMRLSPGGFLSRSPGKVVSVRNEIAAQMQRPPAR